MRRGTQWVSSWCDYVLGRVTDLGRWSPRSESILDHIANYLRFSSPSHNRSGMLNTSYDHGCHRASLFRLEPNYYKVLLIVAGLASCTQFGFAIKPTAWRKFCGGHRFAIDDCAIEFDQKPDRATTRHATISRHDERTRGRRKMI